ncbi:acetylxylan esterase [Paludisphaera sp.]|uniref:alpha/beta hydrolase family protein n=1 Tax=Paludisphaera sp. TaxID=2017432 RepID=UPI00301D0AC3
MRTIRESDPKAEYGEALRRSFPTPAAGPAGGVGWDDRLRGVAEGLRSSFGAALAAEAADLEPEILGVVERDDYLIERLTFQSRPGVRVTANLYRPRRVDAPAAGVLCVHGHWSWARVDPGVQARCIGLAKLGYVCLCVDAFGAGERAVAPAPGTYHGGPMGASTWAAGVPLIGLQVFDNRRAVDYLASRPEVDPARLAITGASGGGNQSLYAGALDDRLKAVVPVCGVGTYEAYLSAACCACEVNPSGMTYASTGDLLALIAPRALLVISASQDAPQFSVGEAARSLAYARGRFEALEAGDKVRQVVIDSGHDYNKPMREAMYGWLDRWLREKGDGSPVAEPEIQAEDPETIRCYPDAASRPATIVTIPAFVHAEAKARFAALPAAPDHREAWDAAAFMLRDDLDRVLGGVAPTNPRARMTFGAAGGPWSIAMEPEAGLSLRGIYRRPAPPAAPKGLAILASEEEVSAEATAAWAETWARAGHATCAVELRALGRLKPATNPVAGAIDHDEAEWGVWTGRPLLGRWVRDLLTWVELLASFADGPPKLPPGTPVVVHGRGAAGTAAILAAGLSERIGTAVAEDAIVRLVGPEPAAWGPMRMGLIVPNLLTLGDFGRLASLAAPRRLAIVRGLGTDGEPVPRGELVEAFAHSRTIYRLHDAADALSFADRLEDVPGLT